MNKHEVKIAKINGVDRIQVKFEGGEEFSLPVDDVLAAIEQYKSQPVQKKRVMKRAVIDSHTFVRTRFLGDMGEDYPHE